MEQTVGRLAARVAGIFLVVAAALGLSAFGDDGRPSASPATAGPPTATTTTTAPGSPTGPATPDASPAPLDVAAFAAAVATPGTTLLDVRTPAEFAAGHLAGAMNLDVQAAGFAGAVADLDRSRSFAVYCHSGSRSALAVAYLRRHGFDHVVELSGGITAWQAAGRPVTTG